MTEMMEGVQDPRQFVSFTLAGEEYGIPCLGSP